MAKIAPSILAADFTNLEEQIKEVVCGGADWIHLDIMDGVFVPNLTFGPIIVEAVRRCTSLPIDAHLMISDPDRYIEEFRKAGADNITVHQEACTHLHRTVCRIKDLGASAGVAVNPATPLWVLQEIFEDIDLVLIMSVNPGFAGQQFIPATLRKIRSCSKLIKDRKLDVLIEVDGGVNLENAREIRSAEADILVAGSAVFRSGNIELAVRRFKEI
jgi:ribulose-phosphate 3-epimerase